MLPCCIVMAAVFVAYWTLKQKLTKLDDLILEKLHLIDSFHGDAAEMEKWPFYYGKKALRGPVTIKKQRNAWVLYCFAAFLGYIPWMHHTQHVSSALKTIGAGIIVPGGGFFVAGVTWAFALSLLCLAVSLFFWWATGNNIGVFFVWAASALIACPFGAKAASLRDVNPLLILVLVYFLIGRITKLIYRSATMKDQAQIQENMPEELEKLDKLSAEAPTPAELELSDDALAMQAYLFDQAFAPYGEFRGFTVMEQFQPSAVRYQINSMLNSLQMIQCHYTPNYHGANTEAQRRLIKLYEHPLCWSYWEKEELWGNLRLNADPVPKKDNVMLTGFFLPNLTMYMKNTGDLRYEERGSVTFRKNEKTAFLHSAHTIAESIVANWETRDYTVFPCEPNWIYSVCNWKAIQAIVSYDAVFGTSYWVDHKKQVLSKFRDEMLYPNGVPMIFKSARTGWSVPPISVTYGDAAVYMAYVAACPEWARAYWAHNRKHYIREIDGKKVLNPGMPFDHGNYSMNQTDNYSGIMILASEMGDDEVVQLCRDAIAANAEKTVNGEGLLHWKCSNEANAQMLMASAGFRDAWRKAVTEGPIKETFAGPVLDDVDHRKLWVAKAISPDGKSLNLVVKNAVDRFAGLHTLSLTRLKRSGSYEICETGLRFTADDEGRASVTVRVNGRTKLTIVPLE